MFGPVKVAVVLVTLQAMPAAAMAALVPSAVTVQMLLAGTVAVCVEGDAEVRAACASVRFSGENHTFTESAASTKQPNLAFRAAAAVGTPTKHGSPAAAPVTVMLELSTTPE